MFVDINGQLYICGSNRFGVFGKDIPAYCTQTPTKVPDFNEVCCVSSGGYQIVFRDVERGVWKLGLAEWEQNKESSYLFGSPRLISKDPIIAKPELPEIIRKKVAKSARK